jgi:glucosyl-3-phosphoglycerate phosphatase
MTGTAITAPRQLVVLRHARTPWNAIDRAQGHTDVQLDEEGAAQAATAAAALADFAPTRLWTSDLARAVDTASAIEQQTGLTAIRDARLREFDLGMRAGLTRPEFDERFPEAYAGWLAGDPERPLVPGEESTQEVRDRMGTVLGECLDSLGPGETGIAVTHGACLKVGLFSVLGWPWEASRSLRGMDNCAWAIVVVDEEHPVPRLVAYNLSA